jgi:prepilin-type N-terminal cleavage/methylation domain-containing protein
MEASMKTRQRRVGQDGFTLVEVLIAMVILVFGLIAVTNLLVVASSSNQVGSASTAATAIATQTMETLKQRSLLTMAVGGVIDDTPDDDDPNFSRRDMIPGVGQFRTQWVISSLDPTPQTYFIRVRTEARSRLLRARSRIELTTVRALTIPPTP